VVLDDVELNFEDPDTPVPECVAAHTVQTDERHGLQPTDTEAALSRLDITINRASLVAAQLYGEERDNVAPTPAQAEVLSQPPLVSMGKQGSRKASFTLLTALVENELSLQPDPAMASGLKRVASSKVSLASLGLSRRSSRGDLEGLVRD